MKKAVRYLIIALIVMWVIQNPHGAAALAHRAESAFTHAAHSLSVLASGL